MILEKEGREVQLSPREFQLFDLLAKNIGLVVPRETLLDRIWGMEGEVSNNNLDSYMKLLRRKLETEFGDNPIKTVRGVGYRLEDEG